MFSFIGIFFHRNLFSATMRPHLRLVRNDQGLGSAGLALGGATFRESQLGEESGSRRRPGAYLVAVAWATIGVEGAGPRGGGTSLWQGGGRASSSIYDCVGNQVL